MDSASNGVEYFSMGSVVKSADLPEETRKSLIKALSKLPYTVLWKFEEKIEGLPNNVHVRSWMPQSSILSHPNIKVFITHGSLLSTLESLYHGVPIIAIPVFGDQPGNAKRCVREGRALMVNLNEHIEEELGKALKEMLGNDSYNKRSKFLSKLFRNRPVKLGKLIQHYVELAIVSKGAYHLRSKTHDYAWYKLWMLDQVAFVLMVIYTAIKLLKRTVNMFVVEKKLKKEKKETMKSVIILMSLVSLACGYHILCIQNVPSKSHFILMKGIVRPLLEAGHQVTMITTFPEEKPSKNLKYIDVSHILKAVPKMNMSDKSSQSMTMVKVFARNISRDTIETPAVRDALIKQNFDAVVTEWFFSDSDAGYAAVQQVPWIFLSGMVMHTHLEYLIDSVRSVPTHPTLMNDFPVPMNFWQRLLNTGSYLLMAGSYLLDYNTNKENYESHFNSIAAARGIVLPPFTNAVHNISILLVNSHPSFAPAMSLPPNVVDIAGYHIDENIPPLPKDLQDIMDSSSNGVVYFSMGSVVKSAELPEEIRKSLIKVLSKLPYTVLWKFEEKIEGLPKNVHVRPWMPQSSILSHPNIKVFITHGGLLSTLESLYHGVPIIAIPVFGDQPGNAKRCVREGRALMVNLDEHIEEELGKALKEMLGNDSYNKRAKFLSKLFRNRPVKQGKLIQHYVELAIESKGAYHLRSKSHVYAWYELWMLDQLAFVLVIIYIIINLIKKAVSLFTQKEKQKKGKKDKKH